MTKDILDVIRIGFHILINFGKHSLVVLFLIWLFKEDIKKLLK